MQWPWSRGCAGSHAGGALGPVGVAYVVELVLKGPVPADAVRDFITAASATTHATPPVPPTTLGIK